VNLSAIHTWSLVVVMFACTNVAADEDKTASASRPTSLLDSLQGKSWATLASEQGGYRLRLLTDEEKSEAEQTVDEYGESRGRGSSDEALTTAYRAMPSDVRASRFYKIRRLGSDAIELKGNELDAILPLASVRVVLIGPAGSFGAGGRFDRGSTTRSSSSSPQEFIQVIRGGGRGGFSRSSAGVVGGLLGAVVEANKESDSKQQDSKPTVFYLKFAEANSLVDIIAEVYADFDMRIAIEPRLNAVVVQCEPKVIEQIEQLIEALDRQTVNGPEEPAEAPTLKTYSIEDTDGKTVLQVLQTLLAGQPEVRISVDPTTNRIIVLGRAADHETIKTTIQQLESEE
jgi:type II secretory pathway component GspD/PulD (secretin)